MTDSMPDAKRKLPVLYVPTIDGAPDFDTQECDDGQTESLVVAFASDKYLERYNNERTEAGFVPVEMALYEPAVPRCRTCKNWINGLGGYRCEQPTQLWTPGASENGFCHNHTDHR